MPAARRRRAPYRAARGWGLAALSMLLAPMVLAAPGSPGVPAAATTLFLEDFENRPDPGSALSLGVYQGAAAAQSSRYTADPAWLDDANCNGIVFSASNATALGCPDQRSSIATLQQMATEMGILHGKTTSAEQSRESVLTAFTIFNPMPPNAVVMETANPIPTQPNRFVTLGVDVVEYNCITGNNSRFNFYVVDGPTEQPLNATPVVACTFPRTPSGARAGSLKGTRPIILNATSVKLRVRNEATGTIGNDTALDNLALFDVTPQLDKQFAAGPLPGGAYRNNMPARMTFTITNRADLLEKTGWGFVENLPAGLVVASTPDVQTTCTFASPPTALAGATTFSVTNGSLAANAASCTISLNVTSATPGTYTNTPANIGSIMGLDLPGNASVTFVAQPIVRVQKALPGGRVAAGDQFRLDIASATGGNATATTSGSGATAANAAVLDPATAGIAYTLSESAAGTTVLGNYSGSYACSNATPGGQAPSGSGTSFSLSPVATDDLTCVFSNSVAAADLQVVKTSSAPVARSGSVISYTLTAVNAGPAAAHNAVLRDTPGAGLDCNTPAATASCSASGGASCPASTVAVASLTGPAGVTIPQLPAGGSVVVTLQCTVTATGKP